MAILMQRLDSITIFAMILKECQNVLSGVYQGCKGRRATD